MDPVYFAAAFLGVELHPGQQKWLLNSRRRENILVTGNRWGKSFAAAVKLIHHAVYRPRLLKYDRVGRYRAVTASITQDQANIIFNQMIRLIRQAPAVEQLVASVTRSPYPRLTLINSAMVEARSTQNRGEYLLGNDYDLFVFDEVAFESDPEYVVEEVILMRLADREGRLDLISTPNGKNWFYLRSKDIIENKRPGYYQVGDSRENNFISAEYLQERVEHFSEARLKQNIMGQFVDSGGEILTGAYVDRALAAFERQPFTGRASDKVYFTGWDLARKRTATVGVTVEVADGFARVTTLERFRNFDWKVVVEKIKRRQEIFPGQLLIDATGLGDVIVEELAEFKPEPVIFTAAVKAELLTNVELFHAREKIAYARWELPDGPGRVWSLEDELRRARWDDNNECDALMALALALWPLRKRSRPRIEPRVARI
ncbi:MAG: terminase large subunit domain-containing protein [Candidatus Zixiibacteriota bacterium]